MGYAVAYPLGVIGIILSMMVVRAVLRVNIRKEEQDFISQDDEMCIRDSCNRPIPILLVIAAKS